MEGNFLKTAYVTGSDRGLGLALVKVLLSKGYKVFAGSYMPEWPELNEVKETAGDSLTIISLDVTDEDSVREAANQISQETEHLDILINNAAILKDSSGDIFEELNFDDMMKLYNTNTLGPLRVTNSVVNLLIKGEEKRLVNISSEAGSIADCWRKQEYGYSMTKTALNMQSAILNNHLKEYGVHVYAFQPGYMRSFMFGELNTEAPVEPIESATGIVNQILKEPRSVDHVSYIDYQGNPLPW